MKPMKDRRLEQVTKLMYKNMQPTSSRGCGTWYVLMLKMVYKRLLLAGKWSSV